VLSESMRPFVQIATVCRMFLNDTSGSVSIIQIMERVLIHGLTDEMQHTPLGQLAIVVILKSGEMRGKWNWSITTETPSKKRLPGPQMSALFEGDERGVMFASPIGLVAEEEGLYWFDVMLEQALLTRIPLRVIYQKVQPIPAAGLQPPPLG
jgi:hypothetical protein